MMTASSARSFDSTEHRAPAHLIEVPPHPAEVPRAVLSYPDGTEGRRCVRALARAEGVEDTLLAEWALSQPGLDRRSLGAARSAAAKGWRWAGEMEEISASMTADGLPGGFHEAAAEVFRRSSSARPAGTDSVPRAGPDSVPRAGPDSVPRARAGPVPALTGPDDALLDAVLAAMLGGDD